MTTSGYVKRVSAAKSGILRGKKVLLGSLDIELTERCNNRCIHCLINLPEDDARAKEREMDTAFVKDLLRQAAELGCMMVRFTGGEPLLREDFSEIYLAARRLGMKVILFTNGRLITEELAALFERIPPRKVIEISVYGMHPASYDAVAASKGAFAEFRRGVDLLRAHNVPFIVKGAILPQNRDEMAEFNEWAATIPAMDRQPTYAMNFDLRTRRDDPEKNRRIAALRLSPEETLALLSKNASYVSLMQEFVTRFMHPAGDRLFSCGSGHGTCIDAYGFAQMCMPLRHPDTVFDLRKHTLRELITGIFPELREKRAENPEYLRRCAKCFLHGLCEQCPGKSWTEHGTLDTPVEYLCEVAHAQARYLGLVGKDEQAWDVADWKARIEKFCTTPS